MSPPEKSSISKLPKRRKAAIKATFLYMVPVGGLDWTGTPAATAKATLTFSRHFQTLRTTKGRYKSDLSMYGTGGRT